MYTQGRLISPPIDKNSAQYPGAPLRSVAFQLAQFLVFMKFQDSPYISADGKFKLEYHTPRRFLHIGERKKVVQHSPRSPRAGTSLLGRMEILYT